jgi:putative alpha-1,2-mannosidase
MQKKRPYFLRILTAIILLLNLNSNGFAQKSDNTGYVNPFIGTAKSNVITKWGSEGGTYPGAVAPSGAIQLSPETRVKGAAGYDYSDTSIYYFTCFNHHSGFPGGSAGRFYVMPVSKPDNFEAGRYSRHFSHKNEVAYPGYYKVSFDDDHIVSEATATTRAGMFRFTFPARVTARIFIGDAGELVLRTKKMLQFSHGNTVVDFDHDFTKLEHISGGWIITFADEKIVALKISASSVNFEGAQSNINKEISYLDFDQICQQTREKWSKALAAIDIADPNKKNKTVFYTAFYHSMLIPWVIDDADGRYTGADGKVHQKSGENEYGGFSPWDSFRSLNPLLTLLFPHKENDVILSMLDIYKQTGHLPTESMTGNHAVPIIVDSYLKGVNKFDKQLAYKAMKSNILVPPFVQPDMALYLKNGYVPFTSPESVTRTVEYAYDDWALAQYAKQVVGDNNDYQLLLSKSYSYRNLLYADQLFLLPRNKDVFNLQPGMLGYKEGDQWVYTYFVPHNTRDLINLLGGDDRFTERLDSALTNNVILFDNETVFHLPYLFNQAGKPELTQKWCRQIMSDRFSDTPGGLPGNDDLGATSSWYVFSALGIYPVCPGRPLYAIGSPLFQSAQLHLPNGKVFTINSTNVNIENPFVQSVSVNGKQWHQLVIPHSIIMSGGKMTFKMGTEVMPWQKNSTSLELSETKHIPLFKISGFSVSKSTVSPDELFFARFTISNTGSMGTKAVRLIVNGKPYGQVNCFAANGQTIADSIPCRLYPIGVSELKIDNSAPVMVKVAGPETSGGNLYKVTNFSARPILRLHEAQQIAYTIQNIGGWKKAFSIPVLINDSVAFNDTLMLEPGEKKSLAHSLITLKPGFEQIRIGSNELTYKVYQDSSESVLLDMPLLEDNKDGIIHDSSGFKNDGRIVFVADHTKATGNKLLFGENSFVELPSSASLDRLGETITMMLWVYPTGVKKGLTDIFSKGDTNVIQVSGGENLTFFAGGWGRGDCTVDLPKDWLQHWHHLAGVCSGKTLYLYIDGVLKGTTVMDQSANLSVNNRWVLGRNEEFPGERQFNGYISHAKIFRAPLSQNEILKIFNSEKEHSPF